MESYFIEYLGNIDNIYHELLDMFNPDFKLKFDIKDYYIYDNVPEWGQKIFEKIDKNIKNYKIAVRKFDSNYFKKYDKLKDLLDTFDILFIYNKNNILKIKRVIYFNKKILSKIPLRSPSFMENILSYFDIKYEDSIFYNGEEIYYKDIQKEKMKIEKNNLGLILSKYDLYSLNINNNEKIIKNIFNDYHNYDKKEIEEFPKIIGLDRKNKNKDLIFINEIGKVFKVNFSSRNGLNNYDSLIKICKIKKVSSSYLPTFFNCDIVRYFKNYIFLIDRIEII